MPLPRHAAAIAALSWGALCAWLLLTPGRGLLSGWSLEDKVGHFALFFVQAWLLRLALGARGARRPFFWAAAISIAYAAILELAHLWVPGRTWEVLDFVAGAVGALVPMAVGLRAVQASL